MTQNRAKHPGLQIIALVWVLLPTPTARADEPNRPDAAAQNTQAGAGDQEAATRFRRGLALFNESEYALALIELERAYELAPNFRALYNIGLVNIQLGRYASATRAFLRYLGDGSTLVAPARREEVEGLLNDLRLRTATLTLLSKSSGIEVLCDGKTLGITPFAEPLLIDAGEHTLRASAVGFAAKSYTLTLAGQDEATIAVMLEPLAKNEPIGASEPQRALFWPGFVSAGVLGAGAIASGVIMLEARSELERLKDKPGSAQGPRSAAAQRANVAAITADVLTGLCVVTAGVSLYLSLRKERPRSSPELAISPRSVSATFEF